MYSYSTLNYCILIIDISFVLFSFRKKKKLMYFLIPLTMLNIKTKNIKYI